MQLSPKWTLGALGLACVACCAPLIPLVLGGSGIAALLGCLGEGWGVKAVLCAAPFAALAGAGLWFMLRRRSARNCDCADTCTPDCNIASPN